MIKGHRIISNKKISFLHPCAVTAAATMAGLEAEEENPAAAAAAAAELAGGADASLNAFFDHAVPVLFLPWLRLRLRLRYGR